MPHILWGPRGIWTLFLFVLSQRLLVAHINQYYEVSQDAFFDIVTYKCELCCVTHSDTIIECAQFCSVPGRPHCLAMALGIGHCWVCGEDVLGQVAATNITAASTYWVHSGVYGKRLGSDAHWCTTEDDGMLESILVILLQHAEHVAWATMCISILLYGKQDTPSTSTCNLTLTLYVCSNTIMMMQNVKDRFAAVSYLP